MKITKIIDDKATLDEKMMNKYLEKKDYKNAKYHLWCYELDSKYIKKKVK